MGDDQSDIGRRFFASQDSRRGGPAPDLCTPDYVAELGGNDAVPREGHEGFARAFYGAFPDLRHEVLEVFGDARHVAVRFVLHGTHREPFFGIAPTGRTVRVLANVILHVRGGQVERLQGIFDEAGMLRQLGVLPG